MDTDTDIDVDTSMMDTIHVTGTVVNTAGIPAGGDGIGTLCLAISDDCPSMMNMGEIETFAGGQETDFDLTGTDPVAFDLDFYILQALQDGSDYVVSGFFQEAGGDCDQSGPAQNDPVAFGADQCPAFTYDGGDVTGVAVDFNMQMPF